MGGGGVERDAGHRAALAVLGALEVLHVGVEDGDDRLGDRLVLGELAVEAGRAALGEQVDRGRGQLLLAPGKWKYIEPLGASASAITWFSPVAA